jgi:hypothetical protein
MHSAVIVYGNYFNEGLAGVFSFPHKLFNFRIVE